MNHRDAQVLAGQSLYNAQPAGLAAGPLAAKEASNQLQAGDEGSDEDSGLESDDEDLGDNGEDALPGYSPVSLAQTMVYTCHLTYAHAVMFT